MATPSRAVPSLQRARILVVQVRPCAALSLGTTVARAHAHAHVCRSPQAALELLRIGRVAFDAAVLDGEMPREDALQLTAALRRAVQPTLAVGVGSPSDPASIRKLVDAGVIELVVSPDNGTAIVTALKKCREATMALRARVVDLPASRSSRASSAVDRRRPPHWSPAGPRPGGPPSTLAPGHQGDIERAVGCWVAHASLSPREASVLKFIALGYLYKEIAEALCISARTVKMHAANVRRKVGAPNRLALVRKLFEA